MAINNFYDIITDAIDRKLHTVGIFLDLSKAFDTLDHSILLQNLITAVFEEFQTTGSRTIWKVDANLLFMTKPVQSQIRFIVEFPKARSLCPYCFLVYTNGLPKCSSSLDFIFFDDDTNIICSNDDPDTLETVLNNDLHIISNWFKLNKLSLNVTKTNYMIFKNKYSPSAGIDVKISIDNNQLSQVKSTKFLGVLITDNLSRKTHSTHGCNIISKYNGIIRKFKQFLPSDSLPTLLNTLVYPHIN